MKKSTTKSRPTHNIFVVEGEGDNAFWTKVGVAWQHNDGEGLNITLTCLPLSGRLVARPPKANDDQANGKAGR